MIRKSINRVIWVGSFVLATYSLSQVFAHIKALAQGDGSMVMLLVWLALLFVSFMSLSYDAYVKSRREGKVKHRIRLFEALYHIQHQEKEQRC